MACDTIGLLVSELEVCVRVRKSRKKGKAFLNLSVSESQAVFDGLAELVVRQDRQHCVLWANQAACSSMGIAKDEIRGRHCYEIWRGSSEPCVGCPVTKAMETGIPCESTLKAPDGRWLFIRGFPLRDNQGEIIGALEIADDVTDIKTAEMSLARRDTFIETVLDHLPVGVIVNKASTGENLFMNSAYVQMMGWSKEILLDPEKSFHCLFPDFDYRNRFVDQLKTGIKTGDPEKMHWEDVMVTTGAGASLFVTIQGFLIPEQDTICFTITDMTKRFHDRVTLKRSEDRFRVISELVSDHAYGLRVRENGVTVWKWGTGNRDTIFGTPLKERDFLKQWKNYVHPEDAELLNRHLEKIVTGQADEAEFRIIRPSGEVRWLINQAHAWGEKEYGPGNYIIGALRDVTEARLAEQEQRKMEARIQQSQKLESLGILAGGIAHDFNNLLMAILGNADLALTDLSTASPARPYLESIDQASRRAASLCQQMLAYSGKGRFVIETLNLNEVLREMTHMLEVSISKKAVLKFNMDENLPSVEADATQIRQILMNLITNASEALEEQSGVIAISTSAVVCSQDDLAGISLDEHLPEGLYVCIEVSDTGCGMNATTQHKMFDPFFTTKFTGRGLGMAAVLGIVRGHKGAIKVTSTVGEGTTIRVLLPAREDLISPVGQPDSKRTEDWIGSGTLLIAEDEEHVRTLTKSMLERLGFTVLAASNGLEAVDIYRSKRKDIVCVLLDLTMPGMDGEETFHELRKINKAVRVVITSGYNEQRVTEQFAGKGLAGFIQKPYTLRSLRENLQKTLRSTSG